MADNFVLSDFLLKQEFVAFDTETTGMWAPINRVVEIAGVKFDLKNGITDRFQCLNNPERAMPEEVIEIHGITDEMVKDAPTVKPVLTDFFKFCGKETILIAHNAPFDISFVGCELRRAELNSVDNPVLDTVDIYKKLFPELPSYSLLNIVRHFEIAQSQEHRALSDAMFVFELF